MFDTVARYHKLPFVSGDGTTDALLQRRCRILHAWPYYRHWGRLTQTPRAVLVARSSLFMGNCQKGIVAAQADVQRADLFSVMRKGGTRPGAP